MEDCALEPVLEWAENFDDRHCSRISPSVYVVSVLDVSASKENELKIFSRERHLL